MCNTPTLLVGLADPAAQIFTMESSFIEELKATVLIFIVMGFLY